MTTVPENEVLIATARWLLNRKVLPYQVSVASGQGLDYLADQTRLIEDLKLGALLKQIELPHFKKTGPDILGLDIKSLLQVVDDKEANVSNSEWWQIECKGVGIGQPATQRNNFDRALSSVVSYFGPSEEFKNVRSFLGLALPNSRYFKHHLKTRVKKPLRIQLNLWVLIYDPSEKSVSAVLPNEDYPF